MAAVSDQELQSTLSSLEFNWKVAGGGINLNVQTKDFAEAVWVISEIAKIAEELNHHPDLAITNYNNLSIKLMSHDQNAITTKDLRMVEKIDAIITRIKT